MDLFYISPLWSKQIILGAAGILGAALWRAPHNEIKQENPKQPEKKKWPSNLTM